MAVLINDSILAEEGNTFPPVLGSNKSVSFPEEGSFPPELYLGSGQKPAPVCACLECSRISEMGYAGVRVG